MIPLMILAENEENEKKKKKKKKTWNSGGRRISRDLGEERPGGN